MYWACWSAMVAINVVYLALFALSRRGRRPSPPSTAALLEPPFVTIQVPVFNDAIATRCVRPLLELDYPADRYEIVIADDSTDEGVRASLAALESDRAPRVRHIHRRDRHGYKPGAL